MIFNGTMPLVLFIGCSCGAILALGGCAGNQLAEDPNFGEAVRYTIALQTADADRDALPLDGVKAEEGMLNYRRFNKIDKPEAIRFNITPDNE
jgi:hypothetical protein